MLSLHALGLNIEKQTIYQNISMSFLPGTITYVKGKNGSGKTSFLRMLAGIQKPTSGKIMLGKKSLSISDIKKPYCTYIGHRFSIKSELTVLENIKFWANIYNSTELIDAAITHFSLQEIIHKKCYELSAGNQKKVALCRLIACPSKLWLLDEVDSNLDMFNRRLLLNLIIIHANNGGIAFIVSHNEPYLPSASILNIPDYT